MDKPNIIEYSVFGRYALFTGPRRAEKNAATRYLPIRR